MKKYKYLSNLNIKKHLFINIFFFLGFLLVFVSGFYSSSVKFDVSSNYLSYISSNLTLNNTNSSLIVEEKNKELIDTGKEYYDVCNLFSRSQLDLPSYVGAINADKSLKITMPFISKNNNLSFIYVEKAGFSNIKYGNAWRHEYYPLQLMFFGENNTIGDAYSFFYISQTQADNILEKKGKIKPYTIDDYKSLLSTNQKIEFDNGNQKISLNWTIANIYLETNYFYKSIQNIMGDFLLGYNAYPVGFNKQAFYFMNKYDYQNRYILQDISKKYQFNNFNYKFNLNNISDKNKVDISKVFLFKSQTDLTNFNILCIFFSLFIVFGGFLLKKLNYLDNKINVIFVGLSSIIPYLIFKVIFLITNNYFYFSIFSRTLNFLLLMFLIFYIVFLLLLKLHKKRKLKENG